VDSVSQTHVHPDHHALWIDPNDSRHMLLGNDGGFYATYDRAQHWQFIDNLPISQFYDVAVDARDPFWIYGGAQDNGQWAIPSRTFSRGGMTNADVINTCYADGFKAAVDQRDSRFVYTESQNGRLYLIDMVTREERWITPSPADAKERYRFNWNTPLLAVPGDSSLVYYGAQRLLATRDRGNTWQAVSPDLTTNPPDWHKMPLGAGFSTRESLSRDDGVSNYGTITTIGASAKAPGTVYVGTDDGQVQMTTDGGAHWTNITSRFRLSAPRWVGKVLPSRVDARVAYAVFDGHNDDDLAPYVFRSADAGASWVSIAGDLPNGVVARTIEEHPRNPNVLFLGTEFGLYWTFDAGRHWTRATGNMPPVRVDRIILNDVTNDLIVATHGRGIIVLDDVSPLDVAGAVVATGDVKLLPLRPARTVYEWRDLPWAAANAFVAPNPPVGAHVTYAVGEIAGGSPSSDTSRNAPPVAKIQILGPDGRFVRELTGSGAPGTHRVLWDLRASVPFLPSAADSGYYGTYRGPFVLPGLYTVKLSLGGKEQTKTVDVRPSPNAHTTPAELAARSAMSARIAELAGVYSEAAKALAAVDGEVTRAAAALKAMPNAPTGTDSVVSDATKKVAELKPRLSPSYGTPAGRVFDLLGAIQSSSGSPTEAESRMLDSATGELREAIAKLNELITNTVPQVRRAVGSAADVTAPVKVP
jgi:hypothetical protein